MRAPKVISLFTGAGGLDLGFEAAGFETTVALEFDPICVETLSLNRAWPVIKRDISSVLTEEILDAANLRVGEADVLIGGPPCQPFSKSGFWVNGEAKRLDDPRAATLREYLRVLEQTLPRAFLIENVEGLGFRGKDEGVRLVQQRLDEINQREGTSYSASVQVMDAAHYGVPQHRRRLVIVGLRNGNRFEFPPTRKFDVRTAWDALGHLPEPNDPDLRVKGKWAQLLQSIPEGHNYLWHTERGGGEPLFGWRRRFWSFLLKLSKSRPAWTLQAQPGPGTGPFHWKNRRLSVVEMASLQTFPGEVRFAGKYSDVQRQLGNAVPPLLAEVIGRAVHGQLLCKPKHRSELRLALPKSRLPCPPSEPIEAVPEHYLVLRGNHEAHPGTGKGYRASARGQLRNVANF